MFYQKGRIRTPDITVHPSHSRMWHIFWTKRNEMWSLYLKAESYASFPTNCFNRLILIHAHVLTTRICRVFLQLIIYFSHVRRCFTFPRQKGDCVVHLLHMSPLSLTTFCKRVFSFSYTVLQSVISILKEIISSNFLGENLLFSERLERYHLQLSKLLALHHPATICPVSIEMLNSFLSALSSSPHSYYYPEYC